MTTPSVSVFLSNMEWTSASTGESSYFLSDLIFIIYNNAASQRRRTCTASPATKLDTESASLRNY